MTREEFEGLKPGDTIAIIQDKPGPAWQIARRTSYGWQIKRIDHNFRTKFGKAIFPHSWYRIVYD